MNIPPKYEDVVAKLDAALAREDALQALSVTRIMLDVVPGEDGMGEEIYAKSVADVEALLSKQCEDIEALQDREDALRDELDCPFRIARHSKRLIEELKQRLTVEEQRAADLKKLLCDVINEAPTGFAALKVDLANRVNDALKPAAEG